MKARIINGRVVEKAEEFTLAPGECAFIVEVGPEVQVGWIWTPEGCIAPVAPDTRRADMLESLSAIDAASARPLRAILAAQQAGGTADASDVAKLADLEAQAVDCRTKLAGLA